MLYRVGKQVEIPALRSKLPECVLSELLCNVAILDAEYGPDRDYMRSGGYVLVAENPEDIHAVKDTINYEAHPCEWANRIGRDEGYLSALYLLNNDFSVVLVMPISIAPDAIVKELED